MIQRNHSSVADCHGTGLGGPLGPRDYAVPPSFFRSLHIKVPVRRRSKLRPSRRISVDPSTRFRTRWTESSLRQRSFSNSQPLTFAPMIRQAPVVLPGVAGRKALFVVGWALSVLIWKFPHMEECRAHWVSSLFRSHARRRAVAQMPPFHIARLPVQDDGTG